MSDYTPSGYDPSKDPKGRGSLIFVVVATVLMVVVVSAAYRLHAFWWQ